MSLISLTIAVAESGEPAVHPYFVGAIAFGLLAAMMVGLLMFGKGREHS